jgi:hypothetical protein
MAMAIEDGHIDETEFTRRLAHGDDSLPLMARVPEPPPSHWGKVTSQARTLSPQYIEFLKRKEAPK